MKKLFFIIVIFVTGRIASQTIDWQSLPQSPNGGVNDLTVFKGQLIACGNFTAAGSTAASSVAAWNGSSWSALGTGVRGHGSSNYDPEVWKLQVFNNELYAAGNFDTAGTVFSRSVAKWNGSSWTSISSYCNDLVCSMAVYNNELYVGGAFDSIGGIKARHIAKWTGSSWQALSTGIAGANVLDMKVYNGELYVAGRIDSAGGIACNSIARWNGSSWDSVGNTSQVYGVSLIEFGNKLLLGSDIEVDELQNPPAVTQTVKQWDGTTWTLFSDQIMMDIEKFYLFNNRLYASGGATSIGGPGYTYVMEWDGSNSRWNNVGTGVNRYIPALCEYNAELYCGGQFDTAHGGYHNYIAKLGNIVAGLKDYTKYESKLSVYPNPASHTIVIEGLAPGSELKITNVLGETLSTLFVLKSSERIDINNYPKGVYYLGICGEKQCQVKIIKE